MRCALFEILFVLVVFVQRNMNVVRTNTAISPMLILRVIQRSYSPFKRRKRKIDSTRCILCLLCKMINQISNIIYCVHRITYNMSLRIFYHMMVIGQSIIVKLTRMLLCLQQIKNSYDIKKKYTFDFNCVKYRTYTFNSFLTSVYVWYLHLIFSNSFGYSIVTVLTLPLTTAVLKYSLLCVQS